MLTLAIWWIALGIVFRLVRGHGRWWRVIAIWPFYCALSLIVWAFGLEEKQ